MPQKRKKVAAVFPAIHDDCQSIVWPGIADYASEHDIDIVTFVATSQNMVATFEPHYDIIQGLVRDIELDGLLIYTGAFSDHFNAEELSRFCLSLNKCPTVCIHQKVEGLPSILIDNAMGMRHAVTHLVTQHGCRRFAFIKGIENHSESIERFNACCQELAAHRLVLDEQLVFPGHFIRESGELAVKAMLEKNTIPDAIIAVNDSTALGVISAFADRGIRVPGDVKVVGFDDVPEAKNHVPSLTTVGQPLREIGRLAFEKLEALMAGNNSADYQADLVLPTAFIPRQSCGCVAEHVSEISNAYTVVRKEELEPIRSQKQFIEYCVGLLVTDVSGTRPGMAAEWIELLLTTLKEDIRNAAAEAPTDRFLEALSTVMVEHISFNGSAGVWQEIISGFSNRWRTLIRAPESSPIVEEILNHASMSVSDYVLRMNLSRELAIDSTRAFIRNILLSLITAFDLERMKGVLKENLPAIGIHSCHLVLYGPDREGVSLDHLRIPETARLVLSFTEDTILVDSDSAEQFNTRTLLPPHIWDRRTGRNDVLFPIVFENRNMGYVMFQRSMDLPYYVYEEIRIHIGNALRGHNLVATLREMSLRDELTGLYNRRGFSHLGNHLLSQARRNNNGVVLMYCDMDKLKVINDTYGHGEGDFAIAKAATLLKNTIREQDVVARIGGDEFAIIATNMSEDDCLAIRRRIDQTYAAFNASEIKPYDVSISVGYTIRPDATDIDIDSLLEEADDMLGKIKRARTQ